jgi:GEVED domain/CARDB/Secretion system C-terminal sorting domain
MMKNNPLTKFSILLSLTSLFNQPLFAQTYCASKGNSPWQEWIANVQFGTIGNLSSKEGYGDFTNQIVSVQRGLVYPLRVTQGFSWAGDPANATQQGRVWIDYNQNGTFEPSEQVASLSRNAATAQILIPNNIPSGNTRMRISLKTNGIPTPCENFERGEVEDYTVNVVGSNQNLPDLTLANLRLMNPTVPQGQILSYKFDLKNVGTGNAYGNFNVKSYISTDNTLSSDDIQDGIVPTANFPAGYSALQVTGASTIRPPIATGQYYLILVADADNQIIEYNENNNIIVSLPFQVTTNNTTVCLNRFDIRGFELSGCVKTYPTPFNYGGILQQYGSHIEDGFQVSFRSSITFSSVAASFYARNGVSTPQIGSKYRNCPANWVYFTATGAKTLFLKRSVETGEEPKLYLRVRTIGDALRPDSLHIELDSTTNQVSPVHFWATTQNTQTCNSCFATDRTPPTITGCPTIPVVDFPISNPAPYLTGAMIAHFLGIQIADNCTPLTTEFQYIIPYNFTGIWGTIQPVKIIQFDSAGNKAVCETRLRFVPNNRPPTYCDSKGTATAFLGNTRMRVAMKVGGYPLACETFEKGEVEDYIVNITNTGGLARANAAIKHSNTNSYDATIFPNPATNEAFLDLKDFENETVHITISDIAGKVLFNQKIEKASVTPHRLNTAGLNNGTYFIEIQSLGKRITRQLYILN